MSKTDVHTEHCCLRHGCKYGDKDCTVARKILPQSYPCESCSMDSGHYDSYPNDGTQSLHYSGDGSIKFWDRVCKLPEPQRGVIYNMGCALQDFEQRLWREIELAEEPCRELGSDD